jgi:ubiquinone/menaquinone biosynthesis C-methylase UbiE
MTTTQTHGSVAALGTAWGAAAEDWASLMEPQGRRLFDAVLASDLFRPRARVLDAGCGSGLFARLVAQGDCEVVGVDASEPLLAIARRRTPGALFQVGDLDALPFPDEYVDIVTGINSFQYAADPRRAVAEARRVTKPGGHVVIATWGPEYANEAAVYFAALEQLLPLTARMAFGPFALAGEATLKHVVASANLTWRSLSDV